MRQRKSLKLYPLTMCYFIKRTQKCIKLFFNCYLLIMAACSILLPAYQNKNFKM